MGDNSDQHTGNDSHWHKWWLGGHDPACPVWCLTAGRGQQQNGQSAPDKAHTKCYDNGRQIAQVDDCTQGRIGGNGCGQDQNADDRISVEISSGHTDHEAHKGPHRKIKVVDRHDEHLRNRSECNRHRQIEQEIEAGIAHGAGLHVEDSGQQQSE